MPRKIRRASDTQTATLRENRRRRWNRAESFGHRDHADTLPRTARTTTPEVTR